MVGVTEIQNEPIEDAGSRIIYNLNGEISFICIRPRTLEIYDMVELLEEKVR